MPRAEGPSSLRIRSTGSSRSDSGPSLTATTVSLRPHDYGRRSSPWTLQTSSMSSRHRAPTASTTLRPSAREHGKGPPRSNRLRTLRRLRCERNTAPGAAARVVPRYGAVRCGRRTRRRCREGAITRVGGTPHSTRPATSGARRMERDGRRWMIDLSQLTWEEPAGLGIRQTERAYLDAERRRVVYVAATPARDLFVVPKAGDVPAGRFVCGDLLAEAPAHLDKRHRPIYRWQKVRLGS